MRTARFAWTPSIPKSANCCHQNSWGCRSLTPDQPPELLSPPVPNPNPHSAICDHTTAMVIQALFKLEDMADLVMANPDGKIFGSQVSNPGKLWSAKKFHGPTVAMSLTPSPRS